MIFLKKKKDTKEFIWTQHAVLKMRFYRLSENRVKKVFRKPDRIEAGIVPKTIALMQTVGSKRKTEIWVMYQKTKTNQKKIITVWRYPGKSQISQVPIPPEILEELEK